MTQPWDPDALWDKARLFINHAMDPQEHRTFDERALWASLALELLGKAALSKRSPVLIAVATEDGANLLAATGLGPLTGKFTTIPAHTVWSRCAVSFRPFDAKKAGQISSARNDYLHGAAPTFTSSMPEKAWWPQFWAQAVILVHAQDQELKDFVGDERVAVVEVHLTQNSKNVEHRATMLVERATQLWNLIQAGEASGKTIKDWERRYRGPSNFAYSTDASCPSCGSTGTIEGEDVISRELHHERYGLEDWNAWVEVVVGSLCFSCPTCHLVLDDADVLVAADLPDSFETEGDVEDFIEEPEYGND